MKTHLRYLIMSLLLVAGSVVNAQPVINSFSPTTGAVGTTVTITGNNFNTTAANNIVYFGEVKATVSAATQTSLTVTVPVSASNGLLSVITNNLTAYSALAFYTTFTGGGASFVATSFNSRAGFPATSSPQGVVTGDLDGDGKPDAASVNASGSNTGTISILRNTSSPALISYAPKIDLTLASQYPYAIAIGDLNGDGKLDLVVSNSDLSSISVLQNNSSPGTISFSPPTSFSTGSSPLGIAIADLNGDGKPDVAVTNRNDGTISLLVNTGVNGAISFAPKVDLATGTDPVAIAAGDLNSDGLTDLVVTNRNNANTISVFKNITITGSLSFAAKANFTTGSFPYAIAISDLNDDTKPDVVVTNSLGGSVSVFNNTSSAGNISLAAKVDYPAGPNPYKVSICDLNGNGKPDLAVLSVDSYAVVVLNNTSTSSISFAGRTDFAIGLTSTYGLSVSDVDADGKSDLVVTTAASNNTTVSVLRNKITEPAITSFTPTSVVNTTTVTINGRNFTGATAVSFGGIPATSFTVVSDVMITAKVGTGASGSVFVTTSYGTGSLAGLVYSNLPQITSFTPLNASAGDSITITGANLGSTEKVAIGGTFATGFVVLSESTIKAAVGQGASGNISVKTAFGAASKTGFTFNGQASAVPVISSISPLTGPIGTAVTINGNNFANDTSFNTVYFGAVKASFISSSPTTIVVSVPAGATYEPISVHANNLCVYSAHSFNVTFPGATPSFTPSSFSGSINIGIGSIGRVSLADIDVDGKPDLIGDGSSFSYISRNLSSPAQLSFVSPWAETGGADCITDIDGDGRLDLVQVTTGISILRNNGASGNPGAQTFTGTYNLYFGSGLSANFVAPGDIDGDGKPDLVITNSGSSNTFSVFRNTSTTAAISFSPKVNFPSSASPGDLLYAILTMMESLTWLFSTLHLIQSLL